MWFCSDRCAEKFSADPDRHSTGAGADEHAHDGEPAAGAAVDPVCGMSVDPGHAPAHREYQSVDFFFCGPGCADTFDADPERYAGAAPRT